MIIRLPEILLPIEDHRRAGGLAGPRALQACEAGRGCGVIRRFGARIPAHGLVALAAVANRSSVLRDCG